MHVEYINGLFNDAVSIPDCLPSVELLTMSAELRNGALTRHAIGIVNVLTTPDVLIFGASFVCNEE
jgi:hypothetical protein